MKTRHVFLHLREHGRSLIVLQVHSFDFFRLGLTEVYSTAPILAQFKGRQFQSLGQAAQGILHFIFIKYAEHGKWVRCRDRRCWPA